MPKYLIEATYSDEGLLGLAADGAAKRLRDVKASAKSLGGKVDAFYFSFGDSDVIGIADFPDNSGAAAFSMLATSSGTVSVRTTPLLTIDEAGKSIARMAKAKYRAPGGGE
jgi:uncharacterized protein with GYD domain